MILFHIPRYLDQLPGYKDLDDDEFIYLFIMVSNLILIPNSIPINDTIKTVAHDLAAARLFDKVGFFGTPEDIAWPGLKKYQRYIEELYEILLQYLGSYRKDFVEQSLYCVGLHYEVHRLFIVLGNLDVYE